MVPISEYLLTYSLPQFINYHVIHSGVALCEMLSGCTNPLQDRKTSFFSLPKSTNLCYLKLVNTNLKAPVAFPNSVPQCKCKNDHSCEASNTPTSVHPHSSYMRQEKMKIFNKKGVKKRTFKMCLWKAQCKSIC